MKNKIILLLITVFSLQFAYSQSSKVSTAYFLMSDYEDSKSAKDLLKAKDAINAAAENETTSVLGKTWYYRGLIYNMLSKDETTKADGTDYTAEALNSFEKSLTLKDKKFRDDDKVIRILQEMTVNSFNSGVELFKKQDYKMAYSKFKSVQNLNAIVKANGEKPAVNNLTAVEYTGIAASNAGMNEEGIEAFKIMIEKDTENNFYFKLASLYKNLGKDDLYKETLEKGAKAFPEDIDIIFAQLNILIKAGKSEEALTIIDKAISLQPDNAMLYFVKGNSLDAMGKESEAIELYKKSIEIEPKNQDAYNNIAAVYTKQAKVLYKEMNDLGTSSADNIKFDELNATRKGILAKAIPFLEKSLELFPDDAVTAKSLKQMKRIVNE